MLGHDVGAVTVGEVAGLYFVAFIEVVLGYIAIAVLLLDGAELIACLLTSLCVGLILAYGLSNVVAHSLCLGVGSHQRVERCDVAPSSHCGLIIVEQRLCGNFLLVRLCFLCYQELTEGGERIVVSYVGIVLTVLINDARSGIEHGICIGANGLEPNGVDKRLAIQQPCQLARTYFFFYCDVLILYAGGTIRVGHCSRASVDIRINICTFNVVACHHANVVAVTDDSAAANVATQSSTLACTLNGAGVVAVLDGELGSSAIVATDDSSGVAVRCNDYSLLADALQDDVAFTIGCTNDAHIRDTIDGARVVQHKVLYRSTSDDSTEETYVLALNIDIKVRDFVTLAVEGGMIGRCLRTNRLEVLHAGKVKVCRQASISSTVVAVHIGCKPLHLLGRTKLIDAVHRGKPCLVGIAADIADTIDEIMVVALAGTTVAVNEFVALGLAVASQVIGHIHRLVRAVQQGRSVLFERLEPNGSFALRTVEQIAHLTAGKVSFFGRRVVVVVSHGSLATLAAIRTEGSTVFAHHASGIVSIAVPEEGCLARREVTHHGTSRRSAARSEACIVQREVDHAAVLDGTRSVATNQGTTSHCRSTVAVDGDVLDAQIAEGSTEKQSDEAQMITVALGRRNRHVRDRVTLTVEDTTESGTVRTGKADGSEVLHRAHVDVLRQLEISCTYVVALTHIV